MLLLIVYMEEKNVIMNRMKLAILLITILLIGCTTQTKEEKEKSIPINPSNPPKFHYNQKAHHSTHLVYIQGLN